MSQDKIAIQHYAEPTMGAQINLQGGRVLKTHAIEQCQGREFGCVVHNPSNHHMLDWPLNWRGDRALMERICEHGIGHPDPDDIAYKKFAYGEERGSAEGVHGCDGCCFKPEYKHRKDDE